MLKNSSLIVLLLACICLEGFCITFDFQCGCLEGWTVIGTAFVNQPTLGDNPTERHRGMPSQHQGSYWIGGYQNYTSISGIPGSVVGDGPTGTMTSGPFLIEKKIISFLISGGNLPTIHLDLVNFETNAVIYRQTGQNSQTLERRYWDVKQYLGKYVYIRAVDQQSGGWGHLNFDDFEFADTFIPKLLLLDPCVIRPCYKPKDPIIDPTPSLSCPQPGIKKWKQIEKQRINKGIISNLTGISGLAQINKLKP